WTLIPWPTLTVSTPINSSWGWAKIPSPCRPQTKTSSPWLPKPPKLYWNATTPQKFARYYLPPNPPWISPKPPGYSSTTSWSCPPCSFPYNPTKPVIPQLPPSNCPSTRPPG